MSGGEGRGGGVEGMRGRGKKMSRHLLSAVGKRWASRQVVLTMRHTTHPETTVVHARKDLPPLLLLLLPPLRLVRLDDD